MHSRSRALCATRQAARKESCKYQRTLGGTTTCLPPRRRASSSSRTAAAHERSSAPTLAAALRRACTFLRSSSSSPLAPNQASSQSAKCWTKSPRACHHNSDCPSIRSTAEGTLNPFKEEGMLIRMRLSADRQRAWKEEYSWANCHSKNICKNMQMVKQFKGFTLDYNLIFSDTQASNLCARLRSLSKTTREPAMFSAQPCPQPASTAYSLKMAQQCGVNYQRIPM